MTKWMEDIGPAVLKHFTITRIESDTKATAYYVRREPDIQKRFEILREELKVMGFLAALREDDSRPPIKDVIHGLAINPQLHDIMQRIEDAREQDVRRVWIDRFFELALCPQCSSHLAVHHGEVSCPTCRWDPSPVTESRFVIVVTPFPTIRPRSIRVNIVLLVITIITTTITGANLWMGYRNESQDASMFEQFVLAVTIPEYLAMGALYFSAPLMIILGVHEFGHYYMTKRHGLSASLPFFIPFPPIYSILGTMGAFISMREPIPNKKALFDIGIAGPVAGLIMAIPITLAGLWLTESSEPVYSAGEGPNFFIGIPIIFHLMERLVPTDGSIHPLAFAGWVGLFLTALNLLPAGQLDGGHVARALLGERSVILSYLTLAIMVIFGLFVYPGWLLLAAFVMFAGAYHPPPLNELMEIDIKRKAMGVFSVVMLILCFTPQPLVPVDYDLSAISPEGPADIEPGGSVNLTIFIQNAGQVDNTYEITVSSAPEMWSVVMDRTNVTLPSRKDDREASKARILVTISAPLNATPGTSEEVEVLIRSQNNSASSFTTTRPKQTVSFVLRVLNPFDFSIEIPEEPLTVTRDAGNTTNVTVLNTGIHPITVRIHTILEATNPEGWNHSISKTECELEPDDSADVTLTVTGHDVPDGSTARITIIGMSTNPGGEMVRFTMVHTTFREVTDEDDTGGP